MFRHPGESRDPSCCCNTPWNQGGFRLSPTAVRGNAPPMAPGRDGHAGNDTSSRRTSGSMLILLALQAHTATSNRIPAFAGMTVQAFGAERIVATPGSTIFVKHNTPPTTRKPTVVPPDSSAPSPE